VRAVTDRVKGFQQMKSGLGNEPAKKLDKINENMM
jgi:hypothetical protein